MHTLSQRDDLGAVRSESNKVAEPTSSAVSVRFFIPERLTPKPRCHAEHHDVVLAVLLSLICQIAPSDSHPPEKRARLRIGCFERTFQAFGSVTPILIGRHCRRLSSPRWPERNASKSVPCSKKENRAFSVRRPPSPFSSGAPALMMPKSNVN
jgi:hypothetical protein